MRSQRGFTLLEVLVAVSIIAGAVIVIGNAWTGNFSRVEKMRVSYRAAALLERIMVETKIKYQDAFAQIPEEDKGEFEGLKNYHWELKSKEFELPSLRGLMIQQEQETPGQGADETMLTMADQITEFFGTAVKEVQVTVVYTKGTKQLRYPVSTYFIDYNQTLPILSAAAAADAAGGEQTQPQNPNPQNNEPAPPPPPPPPGP